MSAVIKTVNLTKRYGSLVALSNLNLEINEGDCFGFIGPNGAGKTTTIRILATLLQPTWGEARVCGFVVGYQSRSIRPLLGFVPDAFGTYDDMVVREYLEFFAAAYEIHGQAREKAVRDVLELTDLSHKHDAPVDGLSRGMKQRLSIARVLLHDPRVLLLDEPAGNLDPRARIELRELLKTLRGMGKTILISSHILPELADLCNTVGILEGGELVYSGPVSDILRRARTATVLRVRIADRQDEAGRLLEAEPGVHRVEAEDGMLHVVLNDSAPDGSFIATRLVQSGFRLTTLAEEEVNLETAFMKLTKGLVQ